MMGLDFGIIGSAIAGGIAGGADQALQDNLLQQKQAATMQMNYALAQLHVAQAGQEQQQKINIDLANAPQTTAVDAAKATAVTTATKTADTQVAANAPLSAADQATKAQQQQFHADQVAQTQATLASTNEYRAARLAQEAASQQANRDLRQGIHDDVYGSKTDAAADKQANIQAKQDAAWKDTKATDPDNNTLQANPYFPGYLRSTSSATPAQPADSGFLGAGNVASSITGGAVTLGATPAVPAQGPVTKYYDAKSGKQVPPPVTSSRASPAGAAGASAGTATSIPPLDQWLSMAQSMPANKGKTPQQLTDYYNSKYGGQ